MPAVSLFNETVRKVSELESELAASYERIRNLEIALKAARQDKMRAIWRGRSATSFPMLASKETIQDLNSLSDGDVEELFRQHAAQNGPQAAPKKWWQFWR